MGNNKMRLSTRNLTPNSVTINMLPKNGKACVKVMKYTKSMRETEHLGTRCNYMLYNMNVDSIPQMPCNHRTFLESLS